MPLRAEVVAATGCACFDCCARFAPAEIVAWYDDGRTAVCPRCGVAAALAERPGLSLSDELLQAMQQHSFGT